MNQRRVRIIGVLLAALAFAALSGLAGGGASADPAPTPGVEITQPTFVAPPPADPTGPQTNGFGAGGCTGSFFDPLPAGYGVFDWGSYIQCTSPVPTQMSVRIYSCINMGPDGFDCSTYASGSAGPLEVAYFNRTDVYVNCVAGVGGYFKPEIYYLMVNNSVYPGVEGNMQYITSDECTN